MDKFSQFLNSIKSKHNDFLLESIIKGYKAIVESPDQVILPGTGKRLNYKDPDTLPVIFINDNLYIDKDLNGGNHYELLDSIAKKLSLTEKYKESSRSEILKSIDLMKEYEKEDDYINYGYQGRLWRNNKIITFWQDLPLDVFKKIISGLRDNGLDISDDWRIEAYKINEEGKNLPELIPINEYTGPGGNSTANDELDKARELHIMDPIEKQKEKNRNPDRELPTKDVNKPADMTMAEYKYSNVSGD